MSQELINEIKQQINSDQPESRKIGWQRYFDFNLSEDKQGLKVENIKDNYINDEFLSVLADLTIKRINIIRLDLRESDNIIAFFKALTQIQSLVDLQITVYGYRAPIAAYLEAINMLENMQQLEKLVWQDTELGHCGILQIANLFRSKNNIKVLDISNNSNCTTDYEDHISTQMIATCYTATYLTRQLHKNDSLVELNIADNYFSEEGLFAISDLLKENTALKVIDYSDNRLPMSEYEEDFGSAVDALAEALQVNNTLETLHLRSLNLTTDEAIKIISAGQSLKYLDFGNKKYGTSIAFRSKDELEKLIACLKEAHKANCKTTVYINDTHCNLADEASIDKLSKMNF